MDHSATAAMPLVLDVEGTLVRSDFLFESAVAYLKPNPLRLLRVFWWLVKGRNHLKSKLAEAVTLDFENLPMNEELVAFARKAAEQGRPVYLLTASDVQFTERLAQRASYLSGVITGGGRADIDGEKTAKADMLVKRFPQGFDYAGNSHSDLEIWRHARQAILVETSSDVERKVASMAPIAARFPAQPWFKELSKSLRLHQWVKNALVFVPIVLAGHFTELNAVMDTLLAFLALCVIASTTYLINDIWDLADDRKHWSKKNRPMASGRLPIVIGATAVPIAILIGLLLGALASLQVVAVLLIYLAITMAYSFGLKRFALVDGFILAVLFTLRLALGTVAAQVPPSQWLMVFSMFLFTSLSLAKRHAEIERVIKHNSDAVSGRDYRAGDAPLVLAVGVSAGIGAVLIMVLYIVEDAFTKSFYGNTMWLWGFPPLLFLFVSRIWLVCQRGEMSDDPVAFALKDKSCLGLLALFIICFGFAWLGPEWF